MGPALFSSRDSIPCLLLFCLISLLHSRVHGLFPGATPDEGDVRHLYPSATLAVVVDSHAHALPYLLGWLENLEYPKKRLNVDVFMLRGAKEDTSREQVQWWCRQTADLFKSLQSVETASLDSRSWHEEALFRARKRQSSFLLIWHADVLPKDAGLLARLFKKTAPVLSTLLVRPAESVDGQWNVADLEEAELKIGREETALEISSPSFPLLFNLDLMDSSYLTFDAGNVAGYKGDADPVAVLGHSARSMSIRVLAVRSEDAGWHFYDGYPLKQRRATMRYLLASLIADHGPHPLPQSRVVRAPTPDPSTVGFDKVYVINLARRPERRRRMQSICETIGLECEVFPAVDGKALPKDVEVKQLEGYLDPYKKRPLLNGEIGCFMSHYNIWQEVQSRGLKRVIVLEDDGRFETGALDKLQETMHDIDEKHFDWDLIYLGRKRLESENHREFWVPDIRHLSTVGYSYWTVAYTLSNSGAARLLHGNPLQKMVAVDEYIPIMADVHPNREWSEAFEERVLKAFTLYPLIVHPQKYVSEDGYVSDTEAVEVREKTEL